MTTSRALLAATFLLVLTLWLDGGALLAEGMEKPAPTTNTERFLAAVQQMLTPAGMQVELLGSRPQALALSPDGKLLATSGKSSELILVDPAKGEVLQEVDLPSDKSNAENAGVVSSHILEPDEEGQLSFTGLIFSPDGTRVFLSNVRGSIKVFAVGADLRARGLYSIPLPPSGVSDREQDIPAGLAISADGKKLYVALNLSNRLLEFDLEKQKPLRMFDVGVAPFDVALTGDKVYVSNWGGRRPEVNSATGPAGHGTRVRVDPIRYIASEGSVSVIDLKRGKTVGEIPVGLHSCAMALMPNGRYLCVANAAGDSVSVIDTRKDRVVETISLRWYPSDLFGASPNALAMSRDGKTLYVCNGTQNAVAVVSLHPGKSKLLGLIPVGWYPGAVIEDARRHALYVANIKGTVPKLRRPKYNSHQYFGTLSLLPVPGEEELARQTEVVLKNYRRELVETALQPARPDVPAKPVPERTGEPSVFKHVIYIVKENRTYDQVLGDVREGNGDRSLCVFGEKYTPNQHKLAREFVLLDNTYCSGILSADGHQWAMSAIATDYMERSFAGFPRSYPDGMEPNDVDALAYSPAGFIWDSAIAAGKTFRDYGEYTIGQAGWKNPAGKKSPQFADFYGDFTNHAGLMEFSCVAGVASLSPYIKADSIGWSLDVPDVVKASHFIKELHEFETSGKLPEFIIICLPNDHTAGTKAGKPTPGTYAADNDLAFGQIVEAISSSRFWQDTCIFAIEDDPQSGWDHVSGYRTTAYVASAYTKRHTVVSTGYNQPGLLRTIELILGLKPMNQMDAGATPMFDCFTSVADLTPFAAVPSNIPFDQLNPSPSAINDPVLRRDAVASARLQLDKPDQCPEALLNRILWHAQKGRAPFPDWAITQIGDDD